MFGFRQTENIWNNAFDWQQRKQLQDKAQIWINDWIEGDALQDFKLGSKTVFEIFQNWKIRSYQWLAYFIFDSKRKIFLVDNHNYILAAWLIESIKKEFLSQSLPMIHIDQHSDLKDFTPSIDSKNLHQELFLKTNVWNYIKPMKKYWLISQDIQLRTEYSLLNYFPTRKYILNIDLDFWVPEMNMSTKTFAKVKQLIQNAHFTFIATSPYFLDQKLVYEILQRLL